MELSPDNSADPDEACSGCGMTRRTLYTDGAMGCAQCYETFEAEVRRALREIHGEDRHIGKNSN